MTEERPLERRGHNPARLQGVAAEPGGLGQGGGGLGVEGRQGARDGASSRGAAPTGHHAGPRDRGGLTPREARDKQEIKRGCFKAKMCAKAVSSQAQPGVRVPRGAR